MFPLLPQKWYFWHLIATDLDICHDNTYDDDVCECLVAKIVYYPKLSKNEIFIAFEQRMKMGRMDLTIHSFIPA